MVVLIIFSVILQTVINLIMLSIGGQGLIRLRGLLVCMCGRWESWTRRCWRLLYCRTCPTSNRTLTMDITTPTS